MTRVDETAEVVEQGIELGDQEKKNETAPFTQIDKHDPDADEIPHAEEPHEEQPTKDDEEQKHTSQQNSPNQTHENNPTKDTESENGVLDRESTTTNPQDDPATETNNDDVKIDTTTVTTQTEIVDETDVVVTHGSTKNDDSKVIVDDTKIEDGTVQEQKKDDGAETKENGSETKDTESETKDNGAETKNVGGEVKKEEVVDNKATAVDDGGWGHWKFYDGAEDERPKDEEYHWNDYPNKDVPSDKFPAEAWQSDAVYVNHFLEEAEKLVSRAKEAILTEYGHGLPRSPEQSVEAQKMFKIEILDLAAGEILNKERRGPAEWMFHGGWTTERSFQGLSRRLLHAMMTKDTFTFVLAGHSAAAGHGNHFAQSYMMQFHQVMEPIFARLGMKLITRNIAQGGLGTLHNALGSRQIYGDEIDMILWDSAMTENESHMFDLFCRQLLLAGNRVPFLMCAGCDSSVLKMLHEEGKADISSIGDGTYGIPEVQDAIQALEIPWAARYMKCSRDTNDLCEANKYNGTCWIERDDVQPARSQSGVVPGRVSWHPGWRSHQLQGRVLSIWVLDALYDALQTWQDITVVEGDPLADDYWHVTDYYEQTRNALKTMPDSYCEGSAENVGYPKRVCRIALNGRTEYTPRANPDETSIRSMIVNPAEEFRVTTPEELYTQPDVPIPAFEVPEGEIDVKKIVSARRRNRERRLENQESSIYSMQSKDMMRGMKELQSDYGRKPGKGWELRDAPAGFCDGTMESRCGRQVTQDCLLRGHNDGRGTIVGDALSGWLIMKLGKVQEGIIVFHIDIWHGGPARTESWTEPNDGEYDRRQHKLRRKLNYAMHAENHQDNYGRTTRQRLRELDKEPILIKDGFTVEIAVNEKITTYDKDTFVAAQMNWERILTAVKVLDDENWEEKDVEVGIRVSGCGRDDKPTLVCSVGLAHVYWA